MGSLGKMAARAAFRSGRGQPIKMTDLQWEVAKLRKEGVKPKEIADKLNTSEESVYTAISRARSFDPSVPKGEKGRPKTSRPRIEELIDKDYSNKTIAKMLGLSESNVGVQRKKINDARPPERRKGSRFAKYGLVGSVGAGAAAAGSRDDD